MGLFGGGGTKVKYPKKKNILDLRTPEAIGFENDLRKYFQGVLSSPNMGFQARQTFDPMELYMSSMANRDAVTESVRGGGARPGPWSAINPRPHGRWTEGGEGPLPTQGRENMGMLADPPAGAVPPVAHTTQTPFGALTPRGPHLLPEWATIPAGAAPGAGLTPGEGNAGASGDGLAPGEASSAVRAMLKRLIDGARTLKTTPQL